MLYESQLLVDQEGPIRYDWPGIKLLYVAGHGVSEIARSMTRDCPEDFKRVRDAVAKRSSLDEWPKIREAALNLPDSRPTRSYGNDSISDRMLSPQFTGVAQNLYAERKNSYLERTSGFIDRASKILDDKQLQTLEDASLAAKLFEPVHQIARDVHGLNAKEPIAALQVNFLSDFAGVQPSEKVINPLLE